MSDLPIAELRNLDENFPELNLNNYNHEDVEKLNGWGIEVVMLIPALLDAAEELDRLKAECEPFLKEGESPAECIARNRRDVISILGELAKERAECERLREKLRIAEIYAALDQKRK